MNTTPPHATPNLDLQAARTLGGIALLVLVGVLGGWASLATIGGAVVAGGQAVVHGKPQLVQSLDGGAVADIRVTNGDLVEQGTLLLRLDPTRLEATLGIARSRLAAALALRARLEAEQSGLEAPVFAYPDLPFPLLETAAHEQGQGAIFAARAAVMQGRRDQLAEALAQFDSQNTGIQGQISAIDAQITFLDRDLGNMQQLTDKGLARQSQMSDLQRARAQMDGQLASLRAETARLRNASRDSQLGLLQAERAFREEVVTQLREVTAQIEELILEIMTHSAQLARVDIHAPATGIVHEMQVSSLGGVVAPGATILEIVPLDTGMDFELRVDPRAIDQVYPGQTARLMMAGLDPQTTPRLEASVRSVSPGVIIDPRGGPGFYRVELSVPPQELARLGNTPLMPGMPIEAFLETGNRSVLSYLVHPIASHLARALRE